MGEWETVPLEGVADIRPSNVDKKSNPGEVAVRLCNYMDVYAHDYITREFDFMEATATASEVQRFGIECGDVMISKDSETPDDIGIPAVVVDEIPSLVCGYHLALLRPKPDEVEPIYLAKQLALPETARYFGRLANGSTRYGLTYQSIARTPVRLAPLPQQRRIAEILSTVDEAIEQTEALIAKLQQIKAGLMHDLFTRGVTPDGQLRPPREEAPELYRESVLGWIPKEWKTGLLGELVHPSRPIVYGILMPGESVLGGVPVVKVKDIVGGAIQENGLLLTAREIDAAYQRSRLRQDDILLTIRGTVGRIALVPAHLEGANITQDTARIAISDGVPLFFRYYLETARPRRHFSVHTLGVAVQGINLREVRTTPVPMPPREEQVAISAIVEGAVEALRSNGDTLSTQSKFRAGLMQDLLTGRVRVPIPNSEAPATPTANV